MMYPVVSNYVLHTLLPDFFFVKPTMHCMVGVCGMYSVLTSGYSRCALRSMYSVVLSA